MKKFEPGFIKGGLFADLRIPETMDINYIRWLWSDPNSMKEVGGAIQVSEAQAAKWYSKNVWPGNSTDLYFIIFNKTGNPVGEVSLHRFDQNTGSADLNVKISAKYRKKGYGSEAVKMLMDIFFLKLEGKSMRDPVAVSNPAGVEMLQKLGFTKGKQTAEYIELSLSRKQFNLMRLNW